MTSFLPFPNRAGLLKSRPIRTLANTDRRMIQQTMEFLAARMNITVDQTIAQIANSNFLKRPASVFDTAQDRSPYCFRLCTNADRNGGECSRRSCSELELAA